MKELVPYTRIDYVADGWALITFPDVEPTEAEYRKIQKKLEKKYKSKA